MKIAHFITTIYDFYALNKRPFPWRDVENSYYVLVSEIMLQQTQTYRVIDKFNQFISLFPTVEALASAPLSLVLGAWQGLGYNRRAKFLQQAAQRIVAQHHGRVPNDPQELEALPGIGPATAASIAAFAYNTPTVFIETNIRAVYIHFFFPDQEKVHDRDLMPLISASLDYKNPRQWYYALMDYGVMLKKLHKNPSRKSMHHTTQSRFEGSVRQIRGAILRALVAYTVPCSVEALCEMVSVDVRRPIAMQDIEKIVHELAAEQLLVVTQAGMIEL